MTPKKIYNPRAGRRRAVLAALETIRDAVNATRKHWTVGGMVNVAARGENAVWRARENAQYPENRPQDWRKLIGDIDFMAFKLHELRAEALKTWHEVQVEHDEKIAMAKRAADRAAYPGQGGNTKGTQS